MSKGLSEIEQFHIPVSGCVAVLVDEDNHPHETAARIARQRANSPETTEIERRDPIAVLRSDARNPLRSSGTAVMLAAIFIAFILSKRTFPRHSP
jgi:hypothetical protein